MSQFPGVDSLDMVKAMFGRESHDQLLRLAVKGWAVPELADLLASLELAGLVLDGQRIDLPGWAIATLWSDPRGRLYRIDVTSGVIRADLSPQRALDLIAQREPVETVIGHDIEVEGRNLPAVPYWLAGIDRNCLAVTKAGGTYAALAPNVGAELDVAQQSGFDLIGRADWLEVGRGHEEPFGGLEMISCARGKEPVLVMFQDRYTAGLAVYRKGDIEAAYGWEPPQHRFEPHAIRGIAELEAAVASLQTTLVNAESSDQDFIEALELSGQQPMFLRAILRRESADFRSLTEALALPPVVPGLLEGSVAIAELEGARRLRPGSFKKVMGGLLAEEAQRPGIWGAWTRAGLAGSPLYMALTSAAIVLYGGIFLASRAEIVPTWIGWLAFALLVVQVAEFAVLARYRRKRKNSAQS